MGKRKNLEKLITAALMTALITVFTIIIAIPVPIVNGYIHLGDSMVFLAVLILGWKYGSAAAALGSAFADLFLGFVYYAPWTFFIKGGMALIVGLLIQSGMKSRKHLILCALAVAVLWTVFNAVTLYLTRGSSQMQTEIMIIALLIPLALIVTIIVIRRNDKLKVPAENLVAMAGGGLFMVIGYYISGGVMYGNFLVSAIGIPPNIIQFVTGFIIAALVYAVLVKVPAIKRMSYGK